jgi:hypothetical protein
VCAALAENSSQDKRELRKKAEEEKVDHYFFDHHKYHSLTSRAGETQAYARERAEWKHGAS